MSDIKKLPVHNKNVDKGKLFLVSPPFDKCSHYNGPFEIDEDSGECKCLQCGGKVTAMFVLKRLMMKESRWNSTREGYLDEMKRLSERSRTKCQHCGQITKISRK